MYVARMIQSNNLFHYYSNILSNVVVRPSILRYYNVHDAKRIAALF